MTAPQCGTYAGWQRHVRKQQPVCPDCARICREYMRAWRARARPAAKTYVTTPLLAQLLAAAPPALLAKAIEEFGRPVLAVWGVIPEEEPR